MGTPSVSLATLRPDLAQSFMQFDLAMDRNGFIAQKVAPVIDVDRAAGTYGVIPIDQLLRSRDVVRAPGSGYQRDTFKFKNDSYSTQEYGLEEAVDDNEAKMYANYFDAEQIAAMRCYDAVLREYEKRVAALLFNTTTFTGGSLTAAAATAWSTVATATPLVDVETAVQAVYANSGLWPNALIVTRKQFRNLRRTQSVIDLVKYSGFMDDRAGNVTVSALEQCFDLKIYVAGGAKNTANEGAAAALSSIWDDTKAMVCVVADDSQDVRRPTIARTFHWSEDGSSIGGTVETYRDERVRGDVVRVRHQVQEKVMYTNAGFLITGL